MEQQPEIIKVKPVSQTVIEFFNPKDIKHLRAYKHLLRQGQWPKGFLPQNIEMTPLWQMGLVATLADAYLESRGLGNEKNS